MPERAFAMHFRSAKGNTDDLPAVGEEPLNGRSSYQDAGTRDEETAIPFRIEHNQGPLDLEMRVRYQACSETVCHPPGNSAFVCRCRGRPGVTHRPGGSNSRAVTGWPPSTAGSPAATCSCSPAAWGRNSRPMDQDAWSAVANLEHQDPVEQTHIGLSRGRRGHRHRQRLPSRLVRPRQPVLRLGDPNRAIFGAVNSFRTIDVTRLLS